MIIIFLQNILIDAASLDAYVQYNTYIEYNKLGNADINYKITKQFIISKTLMTIFQQISPNYPNSPVNICYIPYPSPEYPRKGSWEIDYKETFCQNFWYWVYLAVTKPKRRE